MMLSLSLPLLLLVAVLSPSLCLPHTIKLHSPWAQDKLPGDKTKTNTNVNDKNNNNNNSYDT